MSNPLFKNYLLVSFFCLLFLFILSCNQPAKLPFDYVADVEQFILADEELQIQLIAAEPNVILPVAMAQDEKGRFWVVEMPGYMRDINGSEEDLADGRIVVLEDDNQDGILNRRTIFLDSLLNPRALCLVYEGLLFTDGNALKWVSIPNGESSDILAENIEIVDSLYINGGNIEHQPNGLLYNIDNWIYSAKSNVRYRKYKGEWQKEATTFRGQWGISMDKNGRLVYNHNSTPLMGDYTLPNVVIQNPYLEIEHSTGAFYTENTRIFPIQATAVNRGYLPNVLDSSGKVTDYTSACSPHLYYGESMLPSKYTGSAFVCAPEANLIAAYDIADSFDPKAERIFPDSEFLVSKDETFRPVGMLTGFDGALYIVDMRKGIIQHSAYMSSYLREKILEKGLQRVNRKGRIYKITESSKPSVKPLNLDTVFLIQMPYLLQHPNLQVRMYAQKTLVHSQRRVLKPIVLKIAKDYQHPKGQIHALWTLQGLDLLDASTLLTIAAQENTDKSVWSHLLLLSKNFSEEIEQFKIFYEQVFAANHPESNYLLAHIAGQHPVLEPFWWNFAQRFPTDSILAEALVSGIAGKEMDFLKKLKKESQSTYLQLLLNQTIENQQKNLLQAPQISSIAANDDRTNGLNIFKSYCASCHGMDGRGQKKVAPSLADSDILKGKDIKIADIILNGYQSSSKDYQMMMPAYMNDPNMSNQDILDIVSYLKSTFTADWSSLKESQIDSLREIGM